jgi:hypothetical protein
VFVTNESFVSKLVFPSEVISGASPTNETRLKRLSRDKHSSLVVRRRKESYMTLSPSQMGWDRGTCRFYCSCESGKREPCPSFQDCHRHTRYLKRYNWLKNCKHGFCTIKLLMAVIILQHWKLEHVSPAPTNLRLGWKWLRLKGLPLEWRRLWF